MALGTVPRFSIVVPCHASRAWLRPCLDSVLGQSFTDFEVIGVDDADPDGSGRILDEYAAADARVRAVHLDENVGLGLARNAGLKECRGEYVLFLDADDVYSPGSLEAIAGRIDATTTHRGQPDIVLFDYERVFWDGRVMGSQRHDAFAREGAGVFTAAERPIFLTFLEVVWNKAYRRQFLTRHGFAFTSGFYEDAPWTYSTMLTAERIATLDRVVVHYRQHRTGGNIHATSGRRQWDIFDQYDRVHAFIQSDPELAGWRRFTFDRSLDHILAVLAKPERIDTDDRAEFFHAAHAFAKRWKPEGYGADRTARGFKRWLLIHDDYATYSTLKLSARMLHVPSAGKTVGKLLRRGKLDPNLVAYAAYWFKQYACNPRAIYEKAAELAPHLRGVWVVDNEHVGAIPEGIEYVVSDSPAYEKLLGKATYFVSNMNWPKNLDKRAGQIHLQTQHGTPLKTVTFPDEGKDEVMREVDRWDFNLSSNRYSSEIWERTYPSYFEELEYGYPRNDCLLTATLDEVRAIRAGFGYDDSHLVILYAPTLPDRVDLDQLAAAAGEHARVLVASQHPRIEDLMLAADVLISDYSSITFDYANLDRPILLHLDQNSRRDTYFDVAEFPPGVVARSAEELYAALRNGAFAAPEAAKHRHLYREKFCEFDDGRAAERVVRRVFLGDTDVPAITPLAERSPAPSAYFVHNG
ncbi:CDP-glycerol:poly(glycerophosphate) glycerophosphotransferase [Kribbella sp. VKM Ac-2569]|uniref:bifunctional glycosyltransferase/CDP-glycerol:glycerophosphate glycerophosphotransferase n=1 Tax=Kribbella sp. VKM Ac-2569 TaxID=2512220 RepID=UPI00102C3BDD|nr:CDP-glycerol glycerophosphotransferase family protein [Kribbella sp. VKM Ac-2569]RZT15349.1 CDP-glycerol:poly(glycerophosphate) glycerophosphotransferase [Kribbella sp. VKM Ac-2569]